MGQCNGFRNRLWQLVRIFTSKLVMEKSGLLCWEGYHKKDDTWETITFLQGYVTMVKEFKESHAKEIEKLAADRLCETEKKATDDVVNTPKHTVISMHDNFSQKGILHYWGGSLPGHTHVNQTYPDVVRMWRQFHGCTASGDGIE